MSFLRVGTACAIFNDNGDILLSRRGDLDVWNLPTGRLDAGEALPDGAAREAKEETGVIITIECAVGLYYFQATQRLNVLYAAFPVGGEVAKQTDESKDNRFFSLGALPENLFAAYMAHDAADDTKKRLNIHTTPQWEIFKLRLKLGWRWLFNLLRGKPEPRHVRFDVSAVAVIWNPTHRRVLTMPGRHEQVLPFVRCDGSQAPWVALGSEIQRCFNLEPQLHWVGTWQQPDDDCIELVFAATVEESQLAQWTTAQNSALIGRDAIYVQRTKPTYQQEQIWTIIETDIAQSQVRLST